jgi:nucleoside phosphorylase
MIYILVALKAEAQAFVDKFKLEKNMQNKDISIVISGIGSENMFKTTSIVVDKMNADDTIINVGICGASRKYSIGQLLDAENVDITCVNYEVSKSEYDAVDMESSGFLDASENVKNRYMFKIVSDYFEPKSVTKDMAKKLIFDKIDEIMEKVS